MVSGDAFPAFYFRLHCSPPTISSGRGVPRVATASLSWGGGRSTGWCILGRKLISNVSEVFRENNSMWDFFVGERPISSCWTLLHPHSVCLWLQEAFRHLQNVSYPYSMDGAWTTHPAWASVDVQTTVEKRTCARLLWPRSTGWVPARWECELRAAQEERPSQ